jgi:hypothetical protein
MRDSRVAIRDDHDSRMSHYTTAPLVTNPCAHELALPRRLCPCKQIENTSKNRKEQSWITDEWLAHESWGLTNQMSAKLFLTDQSKQNLRKMTAATEYKGSRVMAES